MGFFIARVSGALLGLGLTLLAFVLQAVLRARLRKNSAVLTGPGLRLFSAIGAAGAACVFITTVLNLIKYPSGASSVVTVSAPLLLFSAALAAHFVALCAGPAKSSAERYAGRLAVFGLCAALASALQFALLALNLALRWNNFTRGMAEYLYIQILLLAITAINTGLFFVIFFKLKAGNYQADQAKYLDMSNYE